MYSSMKEDPKLYESSTYSLNKNNQSKKYLNKSASTSKILDSLADLNLLEVGGKKKKQKMKIPKNNNSYYQASGFNNQPMTSKSCLNNIEYTKTSKTRKISSRSQAKINSFLDRVKEKQKEKEIHLSSIRCKSLENETSEMSNPEINKNSLTILKNTLRKPLYQESQINKEKKVSKNIKDFYNPSLQVNHLNTFTPRTNQILGEKYQKFYEDKIRWKKNVAHKNEEIKLNNDIIYEEYIDKFPFKPSLNENSKIIINKLEREKLDESRSKNNFFEDGIDKESLEKFKIRIKPLMTNFYNDNNYYKHCVNKKNYLLKKNLSEIDINQINNYSIYNNNNNWNINKTQKNKNEMKINYKLYEKKYGNNKGKDSKKGKKKSFIIKCPKDYYLWHQLKGIKNENKGGKGLDDLYKVNVRPGTSWNYGIINEINKNEIFFRDVLNKKI